VGRLPAAGREARRHGPAAHAQRPRLDRPVPRLVPRDRGPAGGVAVAGWRTRRARRARTQRLRAAAACVEGAGHGRPALPRLRPAGDRRRGPARVRAARAQGAAAGAARQPTDREPGLQQAHRRQRAARVRREQAPGRRGDRQQARRRALRIRPDHVLGEGEARGQRRVPDRRLHRAQGLAQRLRRPADGAQRSRPAALCRARRNRLRRRHAAQPAGAPGAAATGRRGRRDPPHATIRARDVHWVRPTLVAEVAFRGWGKEGLLRQAAFKRLRDDKSPADLLG
jgi:hypothetical protein